MSKPKNKVLAYMNEWDDEYISFDEANGLALDISCLADGLLASIRQASEDMGNESPPVFYIWTAALKQIKEKIFRIWPKNEGIVKEIEIPAEDAS